MPKTEVRSAQLRDSAAVDLQADVFGTLPTGNGGTGVTDPGPAGNVLTSDGTKWVSAAASGGDSALIDGGNFSTNHAGNLKIDFGGFS